MVINEPPPKSEIPSNLRLRSLDVLRGFDMFWIIGGTELIYSLFHWIYPPIILVLTEQFSHSAWNGFTFYDLIFPLFLFMIGISLPFSIAKRRERGENTKKICKHFGIRTLLLFLLGLYYNGFPFILKDLRIMGVLQRIALCYGIAALLAIFLSIRGQIIVGFFLLIGYWCIMLWVPVPGIGAGVWTPEGNLSFYLDRLILPGDYCCWDYGDNEGLLSTIPAISNVIFGALAGYWLQSVNNSNKKVIGLIISGLFSLGLGWLWHLVFPVNKYLWSSSFVLITSGWSLLLLAAFYWIIDVRQIHKISFPFQVIGMNSILIYLTVDIIDIKVIIEFISGLSMDNIGLAVVFLIRLGEIMIRWLILYVLYCKKIFLKV